MKKLAHGSTMYAGNHEFLDVCLRSPESDSPKGAIAILQELNGKIALGATGLTRGTKRVKEEAREETPGTNAKASDGN
jgi:hypothetical protein